MLRDEGNILMFIIWKLRPPSTVRRRNLKMQQSPAVLDLCLRKTREGKSHDYRRDVVVFEKHRFQNVFFFGPIDGAFKFLRFRDG